MDDPVLHRKFFREKALRLGDLKPRRYQLGAGPTGVAPITPEGPTYNPYTTKTVDGKVYSLDRMGNVVKVDYLPATINQPQGGMSKLFQGLEAIVDPASASERGTYRKIGQTIFNPKTYTEGIPALAKGAGRIVKGIPGYAVVEEGIDRLIPDTGNTLADIGINIGALGASEYAKTATGKAFQGAGIKNLLGRGALRAVATPAVLAGVLNPYVAGAAAIAAPVVGAKMLHDYRMANNPEYAALIAKQEKEGIPGEPTTDPDTSMMMYGAPQKLNLKDVTPQDGGTGAGGTPPGGTPPVGSDFSNMGGVSQPLVTPAGTIAPLGDFQPKEDTFTTNLESSSKQLADKTKSGTITPKGQPKEPGVFDKLGDFARTASGNAFLLKFAAGLLSGKGSFGEVLGNALNPAVDLFAAYRLKEQELDTKLIEAQRKAASEANKDLKINVGSYPLQLKDGTITQVPAFQNDKTKDTSYVYQGKEYKVNVSEIGQFSLKKAETDAGTVKLIGKVGDNIAANALVTDLLLQDPQTLGTSGAAKYLFNRVVGVAGAVGDLGKSVSYKDIIDVNTGEVVTGAEAKRMRDLGAKIDDKFKIISKDYQNLDESTKAVLAKNGVTAQTLKYFLANAFKDEDRLTNRDLEYIDKITNILTPFKDGALVQAELREVQSYLKNKQENYVRQLRRQGYDDYSIAKEMYGTIGGSAGLGLITTTPQAQKGKVDFKEKSITDINNALANQYGIKG
jgi:hypothetical protein